VFPHFVGISASIFRITAFDVDVEVAGRKEHVRYMGRFDGNTSATA
jgi:hypothetical protein